MNLLTEVRTAARALLRTPSTTLIAVVVLGLGIGANSAMFSVVNTLVLKPLAIPDPDEIRLVLRHDTETGAYDSISYPGFVDLRDSLQTFESLAAHNLTMVAIGEGADVRRGFVDVVSSNYFETFGVRPILGRGFTAEEERPESRIPSVVLGYRTWQRLGGTPDVLERPLLVNGSETQVVGVLPKSFSGTSALLAPELYMPLGMFNRFSDSLMGGQPRSLLERDHRMLLLVGRLAEGVDEAAAADDLRRVSAALAEEYPASNAEVAFEPHRASRISISTSPQEDDELAVVAVLLLGMSLVVLLVAGLNLAAVQDARNLRRRRDLGVRMALGSGRARLVRQLLVECLLLALAGSLLGLAIAQIGPRLLIRSLASIAPFDIFLDPSPDWRLITATVGFAFLAALIAGLMPALRAARSSLVADLKDNQAGASGRRRFGLTRGDAPVLLQLAFSMVLLVCAGLFTKGAMKAAQVDPGFEVARHAVVEIDPSLAGHDAERTQAIQKLVRQRVESAPGVRSTALAASTPFGMSSFGAAAAVAGEGYNPDGTINAVGATLYTVSDRYFQTLEIPVLAGREFAAEESSQVIVIDDVMARRLFDRIDVIGESLELPGSERFSGTFEVVGVVSTTRDSIFGRNREAHLYLPFSRDTIFNSHLHVATRSEPDPTMLDTLRQTIAAVDPELPVLSVKSFADLLDGNVEVWVLRTGGRLFGTFALIALVLAVAGVYGIQAFRIVQRTHEIGLRMALGATVQDAARLILRDGLRVATIGTGIGLALALATGQLLSSMLAEVSGSDPLVVGGSWLILVLAALLACGVPALRAARLNPLTALRDE